MKILARLYNDLEKLDKAGLKRVLKSPLGHDFSSNDYFSLSRDSRIIGAVKKGLDYYGYGSSSSRYIRGERELYHDLEQRLALYKNAESAVLFNSGYVANIGAITSLVKKDDVVFSDQLNHASLIDAMRLSGAQIVIFPHLNAQFLESELKKIGSEKQTFIISESLFSMDGDIAPLIRYAELSRKFDAALIIDEAHALGIFGNGGSGLIDYFGVGDQVLCSSNGMGKAFGAVGAFVAGKSEAIRIIMQRARTLIYTTALPPAFLCAVEQSLAIVSQENHLRDELGSRIKYFSQLLHEANLLPEREISTAIFPVIVGENQRALSIAEKMQKSGFDLRAIRAPSVPDGSARLRMTANISHSFDLISDCVKQLRSFL